MRVISDIYHSLPKLSAAWCFHCGSRWTNIFTRSPAKFLLNSPETSHSHAEHRMTNRNQYILLLLLRLLFFVRFWKCDKKILK